MCIRVFLAYTSLSVLVAQTLSAAPPLSRPQKTEERIETSTSSPELGTEKAPELIPPPKTNHVIELRPTLVPRIGEWHTENLVELGYPLNENTKFSYVQYFNTALYYHKTNKSVFKEPNFLWQPGFFRMRFNNLWKNEDKTLTFSIQERLYMPTDSTRTHFPSKVSQGMITTSRTYLVLRKKFFSFLEADIALAPTFFIYKKNGFETEKKDIANPIYETFVEQSTDFKFGKSFLFTFDIQFRMTRNRSFSDDADQNGTWSYNLAINPELDWGLTPKHTLGLAFTSDNMLYTDASAFVFKPAFKNGIVQALWNYKF